MKLKLVSITLICLIFTGSAFASLFTGDSSLDAVLTELNVSARVDLGKYDADICLGYNLSQSRLDYFRAELKMDSADIFMVAELSRLSGRPIDRVVEVYRINRSQGWGNIAKQLGIKPGSAEFHALKGNAKNKASKFKSKHGNGNGKAKGNNKKK